MKKCIPLLLLIFAMHSFAQTKPNYSIGILLDTKWSEVQPLIEELQNQIIAVVGEDARITFAPKNILSNGYDVQKAFINYEQLINNETDIILAFGLINNRLIFKKKNHKKPTLLFGIINTDLSPNLQETTSSGIHNFTYVTSSQSFKNDLKALKELSSFTKVGIAIEAAMMNIVSFKKTFNDIAKELGISYEIIPFKSAADIISGIPSDVDAFYLAGGFFFNKSEIKQLADKLANEKIPSFTSTNTRDVELGLMATHQSKEHLSRFFRRISLHIESYIGGKDFSELPLNLKYENKLTINYNTAEKVGVPIKYSLLTSTDFIGNFKNVLSKKKYTLLDVIKEVLNKNLSLASDRKDIALNKQDVKLAKSSYYPDISFSTLGTYVDPDLAEISGGQNPEYSTSGDVILTQVLFSEELNAAIDIQKNLLKAQKEYYNSNQLDAVFNASNSYFNVLILKTNLHIQKQNLDLTKKNLQIANQNFEAGQTGKSDVLRFRSEMAQNTQVFVEAANQLEQAYFRLNQLLNNPINHEIDVEDLEFGKGILEQYDYKELRAIFDHPKMRSSFVDYLTLKAKENAPELKLMDYNLLVTTRTIKLNGRGRFFPILALQGQYNRDFNQWGTGSTPSPLLKKNYNIGLKLSIPIFQQNKKNINKQTAIIEQEQLLINKANIALNISANVHIAVLKLIDEISNIETSNASEAAAKEGLLLTQTAYSSGAITIVELLDSQNNYLFAQLSKVNSTYNYLLNSLQLERYINHYFLLKTPQQNQDFILGFYNYFQQKN